MLATVYGVENNTINYHIKKIYEDNELTKEGTIRNFRIVQTECTDIIQQIKGVKKEWKIKK